MIGNSTLYAQQRTMEHANSSSTTRSSKHNLLSAFLLHKEMPKKFQKKTTLRCEKSINLELCHTTIARGARSVTISSTTLMPRSHVTCSGRYTPTLCPKLTSIGLLQSQEKKLEITPRKPLYTLAAAMLR